MKPIRIQRKRIKGWKKPENTVNCTRSGKGNGVLGNPFFIKDNWLWFGIQPLCMIEKDATEIERNQLLVDCFKKWINGERVIMGETIDETPKPYTREFIKTYAGQNMMCFCGLDAPCHVDYLLTIANE